MAQINPYLTFNGNCEEAFDFYKSVFGGEFHQVSRYEEMPEAEDFRISETLKRKIMHISLPLSKDSYLMGCDSNPSTGEVRTGDNISLSIDADSKEEADKYFQKLANGGNITMPINTTFWNAYFGMLTDKFNINWMISFNLAGEQKTMEKEHAGARA
jgi:PhnB protein